MSELLAIDQYKINTESYQQPVGDALQLYSSALSRRQSFCPGVRRTRLVRPDRATIYKRRQPTGDPDDIRDIITR